MALLNMFARVARPASSALTLATLIFTIRTTVPIEDTMEELKKLVEEGKMKYIGLSEASPDTVRRAHAVHPIAAIQMEWSLWTLEIVPLCSVFGIPSAVQRV
ncbi:unnamed protein product [Prunus armeniaca]|uniref:NADP-dependent oxidoreductase domain-containing protein n=1 Tax=Prunus armeniaca TaxID=36596 RepID=A0A6J5XRZ1_PRUAR|nr:unnamed protein product [Prunus armeniaca]